MHPQSVSLMLLWVSLLHAAFPPYYQPHSPSIFPELLQDGGIDLFGDLPAPYILTLDDEEILLVHAMRIGDLQTIEQSCRSYELLKNPTNDLKLLTILYMVWDSLDSSVTDWLCKTLPIQQEPMRQLNIICCSNKQLEDDFREWMMNNLVVGTSPVWAVLLQLFIHPETSSLPVCFQSITDILEVRRRLNTSVPELFTSDLDSNLLRQLDAYNLAFPGMMQAYTTPLKHLPALLFRRWRRFQIEPDNLLGQYSIFKAIAKISAWLPIEARREFSLMQTRFPLFYDIMHQDYLITRLRQDWESFSERPSVVEWIISSISFFTDLDWILHYHGRYPHTAGWIYSVSPLFTDPHRWDQLFLKACNATSSQNISLIVYFPPLYFSNDPVSLRFQYNAYSQALNQHTNVHVLSPSCRLPVNSLSIEDLASLFEGYAPNTPTSRVPDPGIAQRLEETMAALAAELATFTDSAMHRHRMDVLLSDCSIDLYTNSAFSGILSKFISGHWEQIKSNEAALWWMQENLLLFLNDEHAFLVLSTAWRVRDHQLFHWHKTALGFRLSPQSWPRILVMYAVHESWRPLLELLLPPLFNAEERQWDLVKKANLLKVEDLLSTHELNLLSRRIIGLGFQEACYSSAPNFPTTASIHEMRIADFMAYPELHIVSDEVVEFFVKMMRFMEFHKMLCLFGHYYMCDIYKIFQSRERATLLQEICRNNGFAFKHLKRYLKFVPIQD